MSHPFPPNPNQPPYPPQPGYQQGPPPGYAPPPGYRQGPPPGYQPGYQQGPQYGQQPGAQAPYGQGPGGYQASRPANVPHVAPAGSPYPVLVSTMNDLPGYAADQVFGEVFGLTVRSRDFGANFSAGLRSLGGGEVPEYTQMLAESRHVAVMRMCQMAQQLGANAILAMRFDCNEIAQTMSEVAAYGTAVVVRPARTGDDPAEPEGTDRADEADPA